MASKRSIHSERKKRYIIAAAIAAIAISFALYNAQQSNPYKKFDSWNFDNYQENSLIGGSLSAQTNSTERWIIKVDESAPSKPNVLAKLSMKSSELGYHINIMPGTVSTSNFKSSVKFKIISGENEQTAGLLIRFQDASHFFVLEADATNNRFSLCRAEPSRIICTQDANVNITTNNWHTITAQVSKQGIAGYFDDKLLIQRYDKHYLTGQVGLLTKENSEAYFDDLEIYY